jgi:hypothetical protein
MWVVLIAFWLIRRAASFRSGQPWNARQDMINLIDLATGELNTVPKVYQVYEGFAGLYSIADFPEITVTVSWSLALVATAVAVALLFHI